MQSYLINIKKQPILNTIIYNLIYNKLSYHVNQDELILKFKKDKNQYNIRVYFDNKFKPNFVISEIENLNSNQDTQNNLEDKFDNNLNNLNEQIENLNSVLDDYDNLSDLIYEIKRILNIFFQIKEQPKKIKIIKDFKIFNEKLESIKNNYVKDKTSHNFNSTLFSFRSMIEMLGDQILKIYQDDRFTIELSDDFNNLENIFIIMKNFTSNNLKDLEIKINLIVNLDWIKNPPNISLKSNKILDDNILEVIEKLKPFSDTKSWSIKYSIYDSIVNIFNMINTYGEIKIDNPDSLEIAINELEYLFTLKDDKISPIKLLELFDKNLVNPTDNSNNSNKSNKYNNGYQENNTKEYWKKGTGYGHESNSGNKWDIDEYVRNINNKKKGINNKIVNFINMIQNNISDLKTNITRVSQIFIQYINFDEQTQDNIVKIASIIHSNQKVFNPEDKNIAELIKYVKEYLGDNNISHPICTESKIDLVVNNTIIQKLDEYQKMFHDYRFRFINNGYKNFYYDLSNSSSNIIKETTINSGQITRLQKEFIILKKSITIDKDASIFFTVDKSNIYKMRYLISGPKDTPYSYGLYIFDMTFTNEFPQKPPVVHFVNHGNKRFNPNLYDCGKVCLSLLGTWNTSNKGETWNSAISTFNQILISIQSLILIDEPYFNEPGHEKQIGTTQGTEQSKKYNNNIRRYTLDHSINDLIEDVLLDSDKRKFGEFENIIINHFKFHGENIKKQNELWYNELIEPNHKTSFKKSMDKFEHIISKL